MPEKPRDRPPARSHKSQTQDRANSKVQKSIAPDILSNLHKTGSPSMIKAIMEYLAQYGGVAGLPSFNDIVGRDAQNTTPPTGRGPFDPISREGLATNPLAQESLRQYYSDRARNR